VTLYLEESHFADFDEPGRLKVRSLCGVYIGRSDRSEAPTCILCRQALEARNARDAKAGPWWEDYETKEPR
jgi:hypothetical protein